MKIMRRIAAVLAFTVFIAGCATAPREDGGIVGTGNRIDCEELLKKGRSVPEECKGERTPPRY